jgi:hypothetical protein
MIRCVAVAVALFGCASGEPLRTSHPDFRTGALDASWRRIPSRANVAYFRDESDTVIMANADCRERDAPLSVLANSLLIGMTDRRVIEERRLPLAEREALYRRLTARLDGVTIVVEAYVVKKDGCVYDLAYLAPPDRASAGRGAFDRFVAGFAAGRARASVSRSTASW